MIQMLTKEKSGRDYSFDNLRFILIFCVIFAHMMEVCELFYGINFIYKAIYSFHIPLLLFLFGYFVKYNPKNIIFRWIIPYIVFQTVYVVFAKVILQVEFEFQYTTPYWLLWYLVACIAYQCLLPLYSVFRGKSRLLILALSFLAALLVGFDESVGFYMSLSRIIVFQPWFLLGVYSRESNIIDKVWENSSKKMMWIVAIFSGIGVVVSAFFIHMKQLPSPLLYGTHSYSRCGQTVWMRGAVIVICFIWLVFLCTAVKLILNKKLPVITYIGQNTLPIFLLHGFIVQAIPVYCPAIVNSPWRVIILSCLLCGLLGNKWAKKAVYYISLSWLEKFVSNE